MGVENSMERADIMGFSSEKEPLRKETGISEVGRMNFEGTHIWVFAHLRKSGSKESGHEIEHVKTM